MKSNELEEFIMPGLSPGDCLTLEDIIAYSEHMDLEYSLEVMRCINLDTRVKRFFNNNDLTMASELNSKFMSAADGLIKKILN